MYKVSTAFIVSAFLGYLLFNNSIKPILAQSETPVDTPQTITITKTVTPLGSPKPTAEAATPNETPTPQPTLKATAGNANPTPIGSPKPTAEAVTPIPVPTFTHGQINELIQRIGGQYGIDPNVMRHLALCESEFNPLAKNGSYWGLYQYGAITWQNLRIQMKEDPNTNLRLNAEEAIQTTAYALSLGKRKLWPNCQP